MEWFRNKAWSAEIAAHFEAKLKRARDKQQYLRIQASYLAAVRPDVALELQDRYFALGDHFDMAQAFLDRSMAYLVQGQTDAALDALQRALARERERPNLQTEAWSVYAELVVGEPRPELFDDLLVVLGARRPIDNFIWHAARAIIHDARGVPDARQGAVTALRLADATRESPRRDAILARLQSIAAGESLRI